MVAAKLVLSSVFLIEIRDALLSRVGQLGLSSTWFHCDHMSVCIRSGYHNVGASNVMQCLDIVNIEIGEPYRGRGLLRQLVESLEACTLHDTRPLYVEQVHDPAHFPMWEHLGFSQIERDSNWGDARCFVKFKKNG